MTNELHLTPEELSARWKGAITPGTLKNWRYRREGPLFIKLGRRVIYPLSAVMDYEAAQLRSAPNIAARTGSV